MHDSRPELGVFEQYEKELSGAKTDLKRLADFEQLHKLYRISKDNQPQVNDPAVEQVDDKQAAFKSVHAVQIAELERKLFSVEQKSNQHSVEAVNPS